MTAARRMLVVLGTALLCALGVSACGESLPANVVAEVGSHQITKAQFEHWLRITAAQRTKVPAAHAPIPVPPEYSACIANIVETEEKEANEPASKSETPPSTLPPKAQCAERLAVDRQLALSVLIDNDWLTEEAARLGVTVTKAELQKEFQTLKHEGFGSNEAAFKQYLATNGYTLADVLLKTRDEMLRLALGKKVVANAEAKHISKQEIKSYYEHHTSSAFHPESRGLFLLLTSTEAQAKAAKAEIESGQSFESVAERVSLYHTAGKNGVYMVSVKGHNPAGLETAIADLKPHVLTGPVHTEQGYFLLELTKVVPAFKESLQKAEPSIEFAIKAKAKEAAIHDFPKEFSARWKAQTTCQPGYVTEQCKEFKGKVIHPPSSGA